MILECSKLWITNVGQQVLANFCGPNAHVTHDRILLDSSMVEMADSADDTAARKVQQQRKSNSHDATSGLEHIGSTQESSQSEWVVAQYRPFSTMSY